MIKYSLNIIRFAVIQYNWSICASPLAETSSHLQVPCCYACTMSGQSRDHEVLKSFEWCIVSSLPYKKGLSISLLRPSKSPEQNLGSFSNRKQQAEYLILFTILILAWKKICANTMDSSKLPALINPPSSLILLHLLYPARTSEELLPLT